MEKHLVTDRESGLVLYELEKPWVPGSPGYEALAEGLVYACDGGCTSPLSTCLYHESGDGHPLEEVVP